MINEEQREKIMLFLSYVPFRAVVKAARNLGIERGARSELTFEEACVQALIVAKELDDCEDFMREVRKEPASDWDCIKFQLDASVRVGDCAPVLGQHAQIGLAKDMKEARELAVKHSLMSYRFLEEEHMRPDFDFNKKVLSTESEVYKFIKDIRDRAAQELGLEDQPVRVVRKSEPRFKSTLGFMIPDEDGLYLNLGAKAYSSSPEEELALLIAGTIAHELRHQWQYRTHYLNIDFEKDWERKYEDRIIEQDARLYSLEFMTKLEACPIISAELLEYAGQVKID